MLIREDDQGNDSAYTIAPDGAGEHLVSPGDWAHWSPNGREIGVHSADGVPVTIVTVATGAARDLPTPDPDFVCGPTTTEEQCAQTDFSCPIWTPNGRRLTCTGSSGVNPSKDGIYTLRASDGGDNRLLRRCPPVCDEVLGEYSPSGRRLLLNMPDADGVLRIYTIKSDGSDLTAITPPSMLINEDYGGSWSRSNRILFAARPAPDHRFALWSVKPDGSDLRQLPVPDCGGALDDPDSVGCPNGDWSPDGREIVFSRVTATGEAVYTVNLHTLAVARVSPNGAFEFFPYWGVASPHRGRSLAN